MILNSYKIFLKTCDFNFQILIQSKKEDLSKHISNINCQKEKEEKIEQIENKSTDWFFSIASVVFCKIVCLDQKKHQSVLFFMLI